MPTTTFRRSDLKGVLRFFRPGEVPFFDVREENEQSCWRTQQPIRRRRHLRHGSGRGRCNKIFMTQRPRCCLLLVGYSYTIPKCKATYGTQVLPSKRILGAPSTARRRRKPKPPRLTSRSPSRGSLPYRRRRSGRSRLSDSQEMRHVDQVSLVPE